MNLTKKYKEFIKLFSCLALVFLLSESCSVPKPAYKNQIEECLKNAILVPVDVDGSSSKGYQINVKPECLLGAKLPNFKTKDVNGNVVSTKNLKGKINVLNFWFINCPPCQAKIPTLNYLAEKYQNEQINFIAIARDSHRDIKDFLRSNPFDFTHIANANDIIKNDFQLKWGYPFVIITNEENTIIDLISYSNENSSIEQRLEQILNK